MGGKEAPERIKRAEKKGREQRGKGQATGRQDTQIRYQTGHNPVKGEGGGAGRKYSGEGKGQRQRGTKLGRQESHKHKIKQH